MTYQIWLDYTNGERKLKGTVSQMETAIAAVKHYEEFFSASGHTRTPSGKSVPNSSVSVSFVEVE